MGLFVIIIFAIVILCGFSSGNADDYFGRDFEKSIHHKSRCCDKKNENISFEEESFFDDNGVEHIIDEDLYCAEHDDFYDEF